MLPQGSKACAEPSAPGRATNVLARKLHWHQHRSILHSAGLGWLGLGSLRCAPKMGWIWLDLLYLCYLCAWKYVLLDVKIFLSIFLGLNQLNIYPFWFSLHGGSTINRQVLSSAEEISLMCSCCAVPTSCTLTGRMLCLRKLTEMLVSAKFSQKIYKRIFGLWHTCFASCLARFEDFRNGARNKVKPDLMLYIIYKEPLVYIAWRPQESLAVWPFLNSTCEKDLRSIYC